MTEVGLLGGKIGYARVSTTDQDLAIQKSALERDRCDIVFEEKISGTKRDGREREGEPSAAPSEVRGQAWGKSAIR